MPKRRTIGKILANLVAWLHFSWLLIGLLLGFLISVTGHYTKVGTVFAAITFAGWAIWRPGCIFTKVEKNIRRRHGLPVYKDNYIVHYLYRFFGIKLSRQAVRAVLVGYMILFVSGLVLSR